MRSFVRIVLMVVVESVLMLYLFTLHSQLFGLPRLATTQSLFLLIITYALAISLFAELLARVIGSREGAFGWILWGSVPLLMLSGISIPSSNFSPILGSLSQLFASTPAIKAYIALQTMGAGSARVEEYLQHLIALSSLYLLLLIATRYIQTQKNR